MLRSFFTPVVQGGGVPGGSLLPGIDPLSLPNLELYLRSDIGSFADGAMTIPATNGVVVAAIKDFSGNNRHANTSVGVVQPPIWNAGASPTGKGLCRFFGNTVNNQGQLSGALPII